MRAKNERGFVTIQWTMATLMTMMLFVFFINFAFIYYKFGATRAVLAEGVRAGSRAAATVEDAISRCDDAVIESLEHINPPGDQQVQLLPPGGPHCSFDQATRRIRVEAIYRPDSWLPSFIDYPEIEISSSARVEYITSLDG